MKHLNNIPPELAEEMRKHDVRPNDPFFLLVNMMAATGVSAADLVKAIDEHFEGLPRELRDVGNVVKGEVQAMGDTAVATVSRIYDGAEGEPGVISRISASAGMVTDATILMREFVGEMKEFVGDLSTALKDTKGVVEKRRYMWFWGWVTLVAFGFSMVFASIGYSQYYRLERVLATSNAPAIVRAFAEAFARHPLPGDSLDDPLDNPKDFEAYVHGIGQMPPQLALVLACSVGLTPHGPSAEVNALNKEIEILRQSPAQRAGAQLVHLPNGTWAVRISGFQDDMFTLPGHEGLYAYVYSAPSQ